jgi:uncharacterized protein
VARIRLRARPHSSRAAILWDPWRSAWIVRVRERAVGGKANEAILALLAEALSVQPSSLRWVHGGQATEKIAEVSGLSESEVARRLGVAAGASGRVAT